MGDGVYETSYGSLWHFLTRDLGAPFTPVALRNIGGMDDLNAYNVIIVPDGRASRMRRELGDAGTTALKAWVRSGGVLIGFGGAGELAAGKDLELSTVATVGADSSLKADTTAPGSVPPLVSPTAPPKDRPEWLPGSIFRATLDATHWLTLGYTGDRLPVFIDGDVFWRPSKRGANPVVFTGDSLVLSGFSWPGNTERGDLPGERRAPLLPLDIDGHRLADVVGAEDAHRVLGRRRFATADRQDHVAPLEGERGVLRRPNHEDALASAKVFAQVGVQADQLDPAPGPAEAPLHLAGPDLHPGKHAFHRPHVGDLEVRHPVPRDLVRDERRLAVLGTAPVVDLHRVAWVERVGQLDELHARA